MKKLILKKTADDKRIFFLIVYRGPPERLAVFAKCVTL